MKLSIETYVLHPKYGDLKSIEMIKKAGFDCIDYSFYGPAETDGTLCDNYREYAQSVREMLDKNGITCNQAHAPFVLEYGCHFDLSDPLYAQLVRSIEAAAIMGAENIIVHSLATPVDVDTFAYNLAFYRSLEPYCEKFNIHIAIENLFSYDPKCKCHRGRLHTPALLKQMLNELASPWFVICIDVGHAALTGLEPEDLIRQLDGSTLKALHIHDNDYLSDRHALPYTGSLNWSGIMSALKEIDYQGELTLEIFGYLTHIEDGLMEDTLAFAARTGRYLIEKF